MVPGFHHRRLWPFRRWRVRQRGRKQPPASLQLEDTQKGKERGFALLVVVVALVGLSLMMGAVISATQNYAQITASHLAALRLRGALDGGLATVERELSSQTLQSAQLFSRPKTVDFGAASVEIAVRPEAAKVDINNAGPKLIAQLLRNSGLSPRYSERVAGEIAAGPPSENRRGHNNIEDDPSSPSTRHKFDTLTELALLKDGSSDLVICLAPDITVFTHSTDVDSSTASPRVAQALIALNSAAGAPKGLLSAGITSATEGRPDLYEVTETAKDKESQISLTRQTILRITGNLRKPAWILAETSPAPNETNAIAACARLKSVGTG